MSAHTDTSKPTHLNVGGTIRTVIPDELIKSEREETTFFKNLFSTSSVITTSTFPESAIFVNCQVDIFNMIINWLKHGLINKDMSEYQKSELIIACQEMHCLNLLKSVETLKTKISDQILSEIVKFGSLNLDTLNLSSQNLKGFELDGFKTEGVVIFKGSNLSNASLKKVKLTKADFSNCDLSNVDLSDSTFVECDFRKAKMTSSNLKGTQFEGCDFTNADLSNANFEKTFFNSECNLFDVIFLNTLPEFTSVNSTTFKYLQEKTEFTGLRFSAVFFTPEFLEGRTFNDCSFHNCCFWEHGGKGTFKQCRYYECDNGDTAFSQLTMATSYINGISEAGFTLKPNLEKGLKFIKSSYELDNSCNIVGVFHYFGLGVPKDRSLASQILNFESQDTVLTLENSPTVKGCDVCEEGIQGCSYGCTACSYDCCEKCFTPEIQCRCEKALNPKKTHALVRYLPLLKHLAKDNEDAEVGEFISTLEALQ